MGRGLQTPILVILIGVIGGTLSQGITGLCLGPIMLDGDLGVAWVRDNEKVATGAGDTIEQCAVRDGLASQLLALEWKILKSKSLDERTCPASCRFR